MTVAPSHEATAAYEVLRAHALGEAHHGQLPLGLVVVFRQGLPGWLHTWSERMASRPTTSAPMTPRLPVPLSPDLTLLLASMVLHASHGQPA